MKTTISHFCRFIAQRVNLTRVLVAAAAISIFASIGCPELNAATVTVPCYNGEGYSTVIKRLNPTDHEIALPFVNPGCGQYCVVPRVPAYSLATEPVPFACKGFIVVDTADGLLVGSEIRTPVGALIPYGPTSSVESATLYDLTRDGEYNGGLLIGAETDTLINIIGGEAFVLHAGEARIVSVPGSTVSIINHWQGVGTNAPSGRFFVVGYVNHWKTGSLIPVVAH